MVQRAGHWINSCRVAKSVHNTHSHAARFVLRYKTDVIGEITAVLTKLALVAKLENCVIKPGRNTGRRFTVAVILNGDKDKRVLSHGATIISPFEKSKLS